MKKEDKILRWFYLILLAAVWGSSFILMKRGLVSFNGNQVAAIRMFVSFLSMIPFVIIHFKKVDRKYYKYLFATGMLGNCIPAFLFANAQVHVSSSIAGMLNSLTPVFVVIVGVLFFKNKFRSSHLWGVFLGLAGAVALILINSKGPFAGANNWFGLLIVLATLCYSFSVTIIRTYLKDLDSIINTAFALFIPGIICGIYLFSTDFTSRFETDPHAWISFLFIATLALLGTVLSTIIFNKLVKISNALYASSVTYLIPIVAMFWGIFDGETIGFYHFLAMLGILSGVYLINLDSIREIKANKVN